jgi:cadmium resistance protein CadD (predicted permease)
MTSSHRRIAKLINLLPSLLGIEDLREKREELNRSILRDEEDKAKIQKVRIGKKMKITIVYSGSNESLHVIYFQHSLGIK